MSFLVIFLTLITNSFALEAELVILDKANKATLIPTVRNCMDRPKELSAKKVDDLFSEIMKLDLLYDYPEAGCEDRAHAIGDYLESKGISYNKILATPESGKLLYPKEATNLIDGFQGWRFHVAIVVDIQMPSGEIEKRVIDPTLADKTLSIDQWKAKQNKNSSVNIKIENKNFLEPGREFQSASEKKAYSKRLDDIFKNHKTCKMYKEEDPFFWEKHCYR